MSANTLSWRAALRRVHDAFTYLDDQGAGAGMDPSMLPPILATRRVARQSLRWLNLNVMLRAVFDNISAGSGVLFVAYALSLGIDRAEIARFTAAASFGCAFQMIVIPLLRKVADPKGFVIKLGAIEPLVMIVAILLALVVPAGWALPVLAAATISSAASLHMSRPVRDDWEAAAIPAGLRGRYLGRRVRLLSLVAVAALVAPAILGDAAGRNPTVLAGLLVVGGAFGVLAVASLSRVAQYGGEGFSDIAMKDVLAVAKVSSFRRFVGGTFIYNLPFLLTVPFYQVYFQTVLGMSFSVIVGNSAAYLLLKAAAARAIGSLGDRLGPRRGLLVVGPLYITFFVLMALSTPDRVWLVYLAWGTAAVGDAMYMVAYTSGLYAAVPKRGPRPAFFAFNNLFVLGAYGVGAIVAELLIKWMGDGERMIGPMSFGPYQCLYLIAGATMCVAMFGALLYVRKPARMRHHPTPGGQKNITV